MDTVTITRDQLDAALDVAFPNARAYGPIAERLWSAVVEQVDGPTKPESAPKPAKKRSSRARTRAAG